jgi:hypothetical protein
MMALFERIEGIGQENGDELYLVLRPSAQPQLHG